MQLFYHPTIEPRIILSAEESQHCIRVLRHKTGDVVHLIDGKGHQYQGKIILANAKGCEISDIQLEREEKQAGHLHIAMAPTKSNDRLEWFIEKATELGVDEFSFIQCQHNERNKVNLDRCHKKVLSAVKQSQRLWLPVINPLMSFEAFVQEAGEGHKLIAAIDVEVSLANDLPATTDRRLIMIGPEGDFSKEEFSLSQKHGFKEVNLGQNVLRTETAAVAAAALMAIGPPTGQ